jgi:carbon monoxide dehydrogenase subunit G
MASIRKEFLVDADPDEVWTAIRDFGGVHRLAPGFVTDASLDGDVRIVTFFSGAVARERLIDIDDQARRLVYSVVDSPLGMTHNNASAQVFAEGEGRSRFVWITDMLPNDAAPHVDELMERGAAAMESFFSLLQKNVLNRRRWRTRDELRYAIVTWIEHTYNRRRRQRVLGKLTPVEYELAFTTDADLAA